MMVYADNQHFIIRTLFLTLFEQTNYNSCWRCDMDYMTLKEASEKWGVTPHRINYLCSAIKEIEKKEKNSKKEGNVSNEITKLCTGCGNCASICPKQCISIVMNKEGFYNYKINKNECIKCGLCKKVCAQCNNNRSKIDDKNMYS